MPVRPVVDPLSFKLKFPSLLPLSGFLLLQTWLSIQVRRLVGNRSGVRFEPRVACDLQLLEPCYLGEPFYSCSGLLALVIGTRGKRVMT